MKNISNATVKRFFKQYLEKCDLNFVNKKFDHQLCREERIVGNGEDINKKFV